MPYSGDSEQILTQITEYFRLHPPYFLKTRTPIFTDLGDQINKSISQNTIYNQGDSDSSGNESDDESDAALESDQSDDPTPMPTLDQIDDDSIGEEEPRFNKLSMQPYSYQLNARHTRKKKMKN